MANARSGLDHWAVWRDECEYSGYHAGGGDGGVALSGSGVDHWAVWRDECEYSGYHAGGGDGGVALSGSGVDHWAVWRYEYYEVRSDSDLTDEQRLLRYLRHNYDPSVRPVYDAKRPVVINLGITLTQIIDVDEKNQVLTTNVWLDQDWTDEKLKWNVTDFANITILRVPCDFIWLPDIVLYNSVENHNKGYMKSLAMVEHTGSVFWPPIVRMRSSCKMDITYFPFDDQICILKLGSWAYDGLQVDVTNRTVDIDLSNYVDNGEWELMGTKIIRNVKFYPCCPEPFPDVMFYLHIRRRVLYYLLNVIIPCMLLSSLSLTGFLLPPDSGEKVTLGLTVLLAFSVFMLLVAENMPPTSEYIPLIGIYLTVIMAMSALSVALSVFVLNCHHRGALLHRPPRLVRTLSMFAARVMCMSLRYLPQRTPSPCRGSSLSSSCTHRHTHPTSPCAENGLGHEAGHVTGDNRGNHVIDLGLNGLIGDSVVWTRHSDTSHNNNTNNRFSEAGSRANSTFGEGGGGRGSESRGGGTGRGEQSGTARIEREILYYLRAVLEAHERSKVERVAVNEWQEVARVLDKLFFWLFVIITSVSTLVLLVFSPMTKDVNVPGT
ncbi:neuronal acetylcholine receptor subunit alpha-10-like [Littorina saxatilis]|uniref:neuronal acetylcholine receptor subunit alpha-10-like n=1 Tax=Littorina saxatilis TaxID=31220 RepID=UPI0038B52C4D